MKRIELLIDEVREATENKEFTDETGIQDRELIRAADDAQKRIQGLILQVHSDVFKESRIIPISPGERKYAIPSDTYIGARIEKVEFSESGRKQGYIRLYQRDDYERRGKTLVLLFTPRGGTLKVTYQYRLPSLDKRRAVVRSVSLDDSTRTVSALILNTELGMDAEAIAKEEAICIVDRLGNVKMRGIPVSGVNQASGEVSLYPFTYSEGESIEPGDYVVLGEYASTHSQLPEDIGERYLLAKMRLRALRHDSSSDTAGESDEIEKLESEIVESYREADQDLDSIPVISEEDCY